MLKSSFSLLNPGKFYQVAWEQIGLPRARMGIKNTWKGHNLRRLRNTWIMEKEITKWLISGTLSILEYTTIQQYSFHFHSYVSVSLYCTHWYCHIRYLGPLCVFFCVICVTLMRFERIAGGFRSSSIKRTRVTKVGKILLQNVVAV